MDAENKNKESGQKLLNPTQAELYLQGSLGQPDGYWRLFLQNNRRTDRRQTRVIPYVQSRGRPWYDPADLDRFISDHKNTAMARGLVSGRLEDVVLAVGCWPTGRPFVSWISHQIDDEGRTGFVRLQLADPLAVYRLNPSEARLVAAELLEAAAGAERASETS